MFQQQTFDIFESFLSVPLSFTIILVVFYSLFYHFDCFMLMTNIIFASFHLLRQWFFNDRSTFLFLIPFSLQFQLFLNIFHLIFTVLFDVVFNLWLYVVLCKRIKLLITFFFPVIYTDIEDISYRFQSFPLIIVQWPSQLFWRIYSLLYFIDKHRFGVDLNHRIRLGFIPFFESLILNVRINLALCAGHQNRSSSQKVLFHFADIFMALTIPLIPIKRSQSFRSLVLLIFLKRLIDFIFPTVQEDFNLTCLIHNGVVLLLLVFDLIDITVELFIDESGVVASATGWNLTEFLFGRRKGIVYLVFQLSDSTVFEIFLHINVDWIRDRFRHQFYIMKVVKSRAFKDRLKGHKESVITLYSPYGDDGHMLYSISKDGSVRGTSALMKAGISRRDKLP